MIKEKQKGDLEGILPKWTDIIDVEYNPLTGQAERITARRKFSDKKVEEEYNKKSK